VLLANLHIVGKPESPQGYQILVEDDKIKEVEPRIAKDHPKQLSFHEEVIAFPGLINAHEHLSKNTHGILGTVPCSDYTSWANSISREVKDEVDRIPFALSYQWGMLKNILHGFTTVIQHDSFLENFQSGIVDVYTKSRVIHSLAYDKKWKIKVNWPESKWKVIHLAEGVSPLAENEPKTLLRWCSWPKKILAVHGIRLKAKEASKLGGLIWCPNSNFSLYGETADIRSLKNELPILFGTDSTISSAWDLRFHLKQARETDLLSDLELFQSITSIPADIFDYTDRGEIARGKQADVVIARKKQKNLYDAFFDLEPKDILIVIKSGNIVLFDESLYQQWSDKISLTEFDPVMVSGVKKHIRYPVTQLGTEIKEYYPSLKTDF
jgi:cytosine/adenosine deaminase-related metal-dependent hydrolase